MLLQSVNDYECIARDLMTMGGADERILSLAEDFYGKASVLELEMTHSALPNGTATSTYDVEFYYPEREGGAEAIASIAEGKVWFTFFKNGDVLSEDEYSYDKETLVWLLWGAMSTALLRATAGSAA